MFIHVISSLVTILRVILFHYMFKLVRISLLSYSSNTNVMLGVYNEGAIGIKILQNKLKG
jgi:hypothetical protein